MKKADIVVGGVYTAKVSGQLTQLRVEEVVEQQRRQYASNYTGRPVVFKAKTNFRCKNLKTGREIFVRSATRFRSMVATPAQPTS